MTVSTSFRAQNGASSHVSDDSHPHGALPSVQAQSVALPTPDASPEDSSPHIALTIFEFLFISPLIRNKLRKFIDAMDRLNVGYEIPSSPSLRKVFYRILDQILPSFRTSLRSPSCGHPPPSLFKADVGVDIEIPRTVVGSDGQRVESFARQPKYVPTVQFYHCTTTSAATGFDSAVARLTAEFPTTLEEHDALPLGWTTIQYYYGMEFDIVCLASENNILSVLPAACYGIVESWSIDELFDGIEKEDGTRASLSSVDCCKLREIFQALFPDTLIAALDDTDDMDQSYELSEFCPDCAHHAVESLIAGRKKIWKELPAIFGLRA
ncbi:hypothetical protein K438DRAFT_1961665 [Mycena galopus ATCC 62051]|nr:hypothetical protein K438DRAFT_1961665 [Mycena galopus ATCC 62051]